jgi:glycosyltransferase involved in cell wall biosynthesis
VRPRYRRLAHARLFNWKHCSNIVNESCRSGRSAHIRHAEWSFNSSPRPLAPRTQHVQARWGAAIGETNCDYQNGRQGLLFPSLATTRQENQRSTWPTWIDRLPASPDRPYLEGGLRTKGRRKCGSADKPLVSYVTVVRNNTKSLARTIESVQAQTYHNVEHIVIDGASTDGTLDIIRRFSERIDYFVSEPDKGLYDALNKALPLARGQLICVLNSDDWLEPVAAEIAVQRLGSSEGAALLLSAANVRMGNVLHQSWYPALVHPGCYFMCADACHNGIYATRAAYACSGPYDTSYKIAADFKWIMACLEAHANFYYTREITVNYSLGGTSGDVTQHSCECMRVVAERFPALTPSDVAGLYHCFFMLAGVTKLTVLPGYRTEFLKDVFVRHSGDQAFVRALAWASLQKLVHPADRTDKAHRAKEFVKRLLRSRPRAYWMAQYLYATMRRRR